MPLATSAQYTEILDAAQAGGYAIPAVNVSSSTTLNAAILASSTRSGAASAAAIPRTWGRSAEQAMAARVVEACRQLGSAGRKAHGPSMTRSTEREKQAAAEAGAALVSDGMTVGLGTGSTVARLLPVLAGRALKDVVYVATSPQTAHTARKLGLDVRPFTRLGRLDLAIDGADQIAPTGWLVKGGGGAHTREKVVAAAAERFVVIVSSNKLVAALAPPIPLELLPFGLESTLRRLEPTAPRPAPPTPDRNLLADYLGPVEDPDRLATRLSQTPGVVEHGLFPPHLTSEILVATGSSISTLRAA